MENKDLIISLIITITSFLLVWNGCVYCNIIKFNLFIVGILYGVFVTYMIFIIRDKYDN